MLEMMLNDNAPAALVFRVDEEILTAGVIVADALFGKSVPVLTLSDVDFASLAGIDVVSIEDDVLTAEEPLRDPVLPRGNEIPLGQPETLNLTVRDHALLNGGFGQAAVIAMRILVKFAQVQGAVELIDITQSHLDSVLYTGPASLLFAQRLLAFGDAKFAVYTTMNSISIDQERWQEHSVSRDFAEKASKLANAYVTMGVSKVVSQRHAFVTRFVATTALSLRADTAKTTMMFQRYLLTLLSTA